MPTIADYLNQLETDRQTLVTNLTTKGITGLVGNETFTELVPRVLEIEGGGGGGRLPEDYQEVEYIESTGTQYINTGYIHKSNTKIRMSCNVLNSSPNAFSAIFGARRANYNYNNMSFFIRFHNQFNPAYCRTGAETGGTHMIYNTDIIVEAEGQTATWTDATNTYSITTTGTADDGYNPMFLFNINTDSGSGVTPDTSWSKMRLYSCIISENDVEMRNFVPCYRKSDNAIGLYDLVTNVFFSNQGTGSFIKGGKV